MDTSGEAAEQIIKYSMEGMEYTLRLAGSGTERLAAALLALSQSQQKTKGKTTLHALLKSGKELTVFTIPEKRLREFAQESKRYGVLYCVLKETKKNPNALCDILVRAEDAAKINRIIERLELNRVAEVHPDTVPEATQETPADPIAQDIDAAEALMKQILSPPEQEKENPISAQMENCDPSGHGFNPTIPITEGRPSVRTTLEKIRMEQAQNPLMNLGKRKSQQKFTPSSYQSRRNDNGQFF